VTVIATNLIRASQRVFDPWDPTFEVLSLILEYLPPPSFLNLVTSCTFFWRQFWSETRLWSINVKRVLAYKNGLKKLLPCTRGLVKRMPELNRIIPVPVGGENVPNILQQFAVSQMAPRWLMELESNSAMVLVALVAAI